VGAPQEIPVEFTVPLYTQLEAARLVGVPANTFRNWSRGYEYKTLAGVERTAPPIVTTAGPGRGPVVPYIGLGEAYVLAAFRAAGVAMQRIRPAVAWLEENIGLQAALTSEQLMTDGAEVLWRFEHEGAGQISTQEPHLVVVRNQQIVFHEVIQQYLRTITYRDGRVASIRLPQYRAPVAVDPLINFGQPTLISRGIRVADVLGRLRAGEGPDAVAGDYGLDIAEVRGLLAA